MEGNERRQGSNPHDPSVKRRSPDSGLSSSDRLQEESMSSSSFDSATPGVQRMQTSNMLAGSSSAAGTGEIFERRIRQRTIPNPENLVSSAPIAPEQRGQHSGELNTEQGGQQNNRSLQLRGSLPQRDPTRNPGWIIIIPDTALAGRVPQVGDPRVRTRLISEVRNAMRLQGSGGTIQYQSHIRVPGHWWLFGVICQPEDEDDEDDEMHLDIDSMSYEELLALGEHIGSVSTGSEEYADDDGVGNLDCGHVYHVACIKEWLAQKNSCPICKNTALAT
ncbi:putative E3 ubiquitin-protein ligase HIP1 [Vitis vinifera]|uniref:RING-type E3 ubiquitin transferase n=1 Tax=Vitis vinifera TaxID=29760 RepID=A0A438F5R9_VITVI|nr:putative E3 ubiquitin-protein ligase HIP1 [Vitis vinifera]